jgi:hypothetical protein
MVSQGAETTRAWFYIYPMPKNEFLIPEFHTPILPGRRDDVTPTEPRHHDDLSNNTHDVTEDQRRH